MNLGAKFPNFKAWSNFRLMVVLGSLVTLLSLGLGAVVVQAALRDDGQQGDNPGRVEAARGASAEGGEEDEPAAAEAAAQALAQPPTAGSNPAPALANGESFRVSCPVNPTATQNTCAIESFSGFDNRVELSCAGLPANASCVFDPTSVTPRPSGATTFRLRLIVDQVPPGNYPFDVIGRSGEQVSNFRYPWGVTAPRVATLAQGPPPPPAAPPAPGAPPAPPPAPAAPAAESAADPTFSFTCGSLTEGNKLEWSLSEDGTNARINCFLTPLNGFNEPVTFNAPPTEVARPDTVNFVVDQLQAKKVFDLTFEISDAVRNLPPAELEAGKDYTVQVTGTSPSGKSLVQQVILTITE